MKSVVLPLVLFFLAGTQGRTENWKHTPVLNPTCWINNNEHMYGSPELLSTEPKLLPDCTVSDQPEPTPGYFTMMKHGNWTKCILAQTCFNPHIPYTDVAGCFIACYRDCGVTTASWQKCQGKLGEAVTTAAALYNSVCSQLTLPDFAGKLYKYGKCLVEELTTDYESQVLQVNRCQARCVGMLFTAPW